MASRFSWLGAAIFLLVLLTTQETPEARAAAPGQVLQGTVNTTGKSGADLYRETCAACHGLDGKGKEADAIGFDVPTPDFTDCNFASREPDADWVSVAHEGGPVRGFSKHMPAFGGALGEADLYRIVGYIRTFCPVGAWPRGELNLPRAMFTEKAYPEDEAVVTMGVGRSPAEVTTDIVYEKRFGVRNQIEIKAPFGVSKNGGSWAGGSGDLALGIKRTVAHSLARGSILAVAGEISLPTGDEAAGLSKGTPVFESFLAFGKLLPSDSFVQAQGGVELPFDTAKAHREAFWRVATGKTFTQNGPFGRTWTPMLEVLAARELEKGAKVAWDLVPQLQVSLNTRQHVLLGLGWRTPLTDRRSRSSRLMVYLLWDWFDGGLRAGW
jgi:mono/diheme cytochrome c family protein